MREARQDAAVATQARPLLAEGVIRLAARAWWLLLLPAVLALLASRFLIPRPSEVGAGSWEGLARLCDAHPVPLAIGWMVLFALLLRHFSDALPGGHHLRATSGVEGSRRDPLLGAALSIAPVLLAAAAALALRGSVGQSYRVTSTSMLPTLEASDYVLVDKSAFGFRLPGTRRSLASRSPRRGEIIVFRGRSVGELTEELLVKRVVGLAGDRVSTNGSLVWINGWRVPFCDAGRYVYVGHGQTVVGRLVVEFLEDQAYLTVQSPEAPPFEGSPVKPGEVFVLGDDRNGSRDSRVWNNGRGAGVPSSAIEGRAWRLIGFDRDGRLDWKRLLIRPGVQLHLPGVDTRAAEDRIARCLRNRPAQTVPPGPTSGQ